MSEQILSSEPAVPANATHYAGFWIRFVAHLIDEVALLAVGQVLTYATLFLIYGMMKAAGTATGSFGESFSGGMIQIINLAGNFAISVPYYVVMTHRKGGTLGKLAMKIQVVDQATGKFLSVGQAAGRFFASLLSAILFMAGYLMVVFNREKRALHDTICGSVVVYRN